MSDWTQDAHYLTGVAYFNQHKFFEAHEAWEDLWHRSFGGEKEFIQGLIQMTSALHHLQIGNMRGARLLHDSTLELWRAYGSSFGGVNLDRCRQNLNQLCEGILDVPLERLPGRGHSGDVKIPFRPERAFQLP